MTYFIRLIKTNESLFDCEVFDEEYHCACFKKVLNSYVKNLDKLRKEQFEEDCQKLKDLQEEFDKSNSKDLDEFVLESFQEFCEEWTDFGVVTD